MIVNHYLCVTWVCLRSTRCYHDSADLSLVALVFYCRPPTREPHQRWGLWFCFPLAAALLFPANNKSQCYLYKVLLCCYFALWSYEQFHRIILKIHVRGILLFKIHVRDILLFKIHVWGILLFKIKGSYEPTCEYETGLLPSPLLCILPDNPPAPSPLPIAFITGKLYAQAFCTG